MSLLSAILLRGASSGLFICSTDLSRKSNAAQKANDNMQWIVDDEFYNQQTGLPIPQGEFAKGVLF